MTFEEERPLLAKAYLVTFWGAVAALVVSKLV